MCRRRTCATSYPGRAWRAVALLSLCNCELSLLFNVLHEDQIGLGHPLNVFHDIHLLEQIRQRIEVVQDLLEEVTRKHHLERHLHHSPWSQAVVRSTMMKRKGR